MKTMLILPIFLVVLSGEGVTSMAQAGGQPAGLSASDILKQSEGKYASLTSYSDEGTTLSTLGSTTAASYSFTINLARTNLYKIVWRQEGEFFIPKGVVWSTGEGNYVWMGKNFKPRPCTDQETAIASATGISGGAAASIPGTFFKMKWGNQLGATTAGSQRLTDDKIGDIDCYVLTHGSGGRTNILWIGKQDFLIHQIENDTSAALMKAMMEEQAKKNPQIRAMLDAAGAQMLQDSRTIETHQNIRINPILNNVDFDFKAPALIGP